MRKKSRADKGQFSVIAAFLVAVILVSAVIMTYSTVRNTPFRRPPNILGAIQEMNLSIKQILEFTVGYYGSILEVTGNTTYAKDCALSYLNSGFINLLSSHPDWNPSLEVSNPSLSIVWFEATSYSMGSVSVNYSLSGLGIHGIKYETSSLLNVTILETSNGQARVLVTREENKPELTLGIENFRFYCYNYSDSDWKLVRPADYPTAFSNGTYALQIPPGVDQDSYLVKVVDARGIMATAFFSPSRLPQYTYTFDWNRTDVDVKQIYDNLNSDTIVVEALQNGTLRWLGQELKLTNPERPLPPIPVKALRINQTINGINHEVPFQIEEWESNFRVPLGLSSNASLSCSRNMLVFLVNHKVKNVTLWWDGRDIANQTPHAYATTEGFTNDDPDNDFLTNGILDLDIDASSVEFRVTSRVGTSTSTASFMRINDENSYYGSDPAYVIHHGIVRDIIQQEAEWEDGGAPNSPNMYSQIVLTLPANATYYTYTLRTIFVNSSQSRNLWDLSALQLSSEWMIGLRSFTENGTSGGLPMVNEAYQEGSHLFYNFSSFPTGWAHHWSEYVKDGSGAGIMFTNSTNFKLYAFDGIADERTGALNVITASRVLDRDWITRPAVYDCCGGTNCNMARDDKTWTYWRHDSSCNHWIVFDMGETVDISKIRIYQSDRSRQRWGRDMGIEVYVSDDPDSWGSAVWTGTLNAQGWRESGEFEAEGRYVKLYSRSTDASQRMYEIQIERIYTERSVTIELSPVAQFPASFTSPLDVTWCGAVVTFDGDDPIWSDDNNGLWVLAEYPPIVSVS